MKTLVAAIALTMTTTAAFAGPLTVLDCVDSENAKGFEVQLNLGEKMVSVDSVAREVVKINDREVLAYTRKVEHTVTVNGQEIKLDDGSEIIEDISSIIIDRFTGEYTAAEDFTNKLNTKSNSYVVTTGQCSVVTQKF